MGFSVLLFSRLFAMKDLLTTLRPEKSRLFFRSKGKGRMMLTSAPVSMKKMIARVKISQKQQTTN